MIGTLKALIEWVSTIGKLLSGKLEEDPAAISQDEAARLARAQSFLLYALALAILVVPITAVLFYFNVPQSAWRSVERQIDNQSNEAHIGIDCRWFDDSSSSPHPERITSVDLEIYYKNYDNHWGQIYLQIMAYDTDNVLIGLDSVYVVEQTKLEERVLALFPGKHARDVSSIVVNTMTDQENRYLFQEDCYLRQSQSVQMAKGDVVSTLTLEPEIVPNNPPVFGTLSSIDISSTAEAELEAHPDFGSEGPNWSKATPPVMEASTTLNSMTLTPPVSDPLLLCITAGSCRYATGESGVYDNNHVFANIPSGKVLIVGGLSVHLSVRDSTGQTVTTPEPDVDYGGFYAAFPAGYTIESLHVYDGYFNLVDENRAETSFCGDINLAINSHWAHASIFVLESWGPEYENCNDGMKISGVIGLPAKPPVNPDGNF